MTDIAEESDFRGIWSGLAFIGERFTRSVDLSTIQASDTATYKMLDKTGGTALLTLTSASGITVTSGHLSWDVAGGSMPATTSPPSRPYQHYLEILDSTGGLRALFAGPIIYAERERWPLQ